MSSINSNRAVTVATATTFRPRVDAKLVWDIEEANVIIRPGLTITSPAIIIENPELKKKNSWEISINTNQGQFTVELNLRTTSTIEPFDCEYYFVLGGRTGPECVHQSAKYTGSFKARHWEANISQGKFSVPLEEVIGDVNLNKLNPKCVLRITAYLCLTLNVRANTVGESFPRLSKPAKAAQDTWLANLFNNRKLSDVTIKCDGQVFRCHKLVLFRSPVLEAMLTSGMKESKSHEITISDLSPLVLELFLKSLYGVKIEVPSEYEKLLELIDCAEKYDMQALKFTCLEAMAPLLSDENAGELTLAAFRYCSDPQFLAYFKTYCEERHGILIKKPAYRELYKSNLDVFM